MRDTISALYGMIVAQARLPALYRDYAVPDSVNGRFELIVVHLALLLDRLGQDDSLRPLGQGIFDRFCQDMDHNLHEMGVGDLTVPKEMRGLGEADGEALVAALRRNIYGGSESAPAGRLAAYVREAVGDLKAQASADLAAGRLHLPEPASVPP